MKTTTRTKAIAGNNIAKIGYHVNRLVKNHHNDHLSFLSDYLQLSENEVKNIPVHIETVLNALDTPQEVNLCGLTSAFRACRKFVLRYLESFSIYDRETSFDDDDIHRRMSRLIGEHDGNFENIDVLLGSIAFCLNQKFSSGEKIFTSFMFATSPDKD